MSPRGEAFAEFIYDDFKSRVAGRDAAGTEKGDAWFPGGAAPGLRWAAQCVTDGIKDKE